MSRPRKRTVPSVERSFLPKSHPKTVLLAAGTYAEYALYCHIRGALSLLYGISVYRRRSPAFFYFVPKKEL